MFESESLMQEAINKQPEIILAGIPDINPEFCPDAPNLISIGREIPLSSGPLDNLFIDINAVLTFVECKRYSDARLKREVYPQAINYASDLRNQLIHYNGTEFIDALNGILSKTQSSDLNSISKIIKALKPDPILDGKNTAEWEKQFLDRLEFNIKSGICRVIILCAPTPDTNFNYRAIRNLMQIVSFTEQTNSKYDLIIMDLRDEVERYVSRIIWRRYTNIPLIPLVAESNRNTEISIDKVKDLQSKLPKEATESLYELLENLTSNGYLAVDNTFGYAIKNSKTKKSTYIQIEIQENKWLLRRHQIREPESIFFLIENNRIDELLDGVSYNILDKKTSKNSRQIYDILITPDKKTNMVEVIKNLSSEQNT